MSFVCVTINQVRLSCVKHDSQARKQHCMYSNSAQAKERLSGQQYNRRRACTYLVDRLSLAMSENIAVNTGEKDVLTC